MKARQGKSFLGALGGRLSRRLVGLTAVAALLALVGIVASAFAAEKPITVRAGNLVLTFNGGVTPRALPKKEYAPIALDVSGKIAEADGSQPPPLTETSSTPTRTA